MLTRGRRSPITSLIAEDDPEDRMLAREAADELRLANSIEFVEFVAFVEFVHFVEDGEDLLDDLLQRGRYTAPEDAPRSGDIVQD